jgi:hypothetical protein
VMIADVGYGCLSAFARAIQIAAARDRREVLDGFG